MDVEKITEAMRCELEALGLPAELCLPPAVSVRAFIEEREAPARRIAEAGYERAQVIADKVAEALRNDEEPAHPEG